MLSSAPSSCSSTPITELIKARVIFKSPRTLSPFEKVPKMEKSGSSPYVIFSSFLHVSAFQILGKVTSERYNHVVMDAVVTTMVDRKETERRNYRPLAWKIGEKSWS